MWLLSFDSLPPPSTMPSIFILPPSLPLGQSEERSDGSSSGAGSGPGESCFATERQRCRFLNFISPTKTFFFYYQTNNLYKFGRWVKLFQNLWMKPVMMCQSRWFGVFFDWCLESWAECSHCWLGVSSAVESLKMLWCSYVNDGANCEIIKLILKNNFSNINEILEWIRMLQI